MVSETYVLNELYDEKSIAVFDIIALKGVNRDIIIYRLKLTRKQYYSRPTALIRSGLVEKRNGKYFLFW